MGRWNWIHLWVPWLWHMPRVHCSNSTGDAQQIIANALEVWSISKKSSVQKPRSFQKKSWWRTDFPVVWKSQWSSPIWWLEKSLNLPNEVSTSPWPVVTPTPSFMLVFQAWFAGKSSILLITVYPFTSRGKPTLNHRNHTSFSPAGRNVVALSLIRNGDHLGVAGLRDMLMFNPCLGKHVETRQNSLGP